MLPSVVLTSSLPEALSLQGIPDYATVFIKCNDVTFYTARLYAYSSVVTVYQFRSLVMEYMRGLNLSIGHFKVISEEYGGATTMEDCHIVYADEHPVAANDVVFLTSQFLTSRKNIIIGKSCPLHLATYADTNEELDVIVEALFLLDGQLNHCRYNVPLEEQVHPAVYSFPIDAKTVTERCQYEEGVEVGEIISARAFFNNRSLQVYYTEDNPTVSFVFRNVFNVPEDIHIFAKETLKSDVSNKEASCLGVTSYYDETVEKKHVMESAPLSMEEAKAFDEFLTSHEVLWHPTASVSVPVLLSDITAERNLDPEEPTRMKFSWRPKDSLVWNVPQTATTQIFTDTFNDSFQ